MLRPDKGQIFLGDKEITALKPEERVKCGLVRTFQINTLFPHLSALEAVTLAVCERRGDARRRGGERPPPCGAVPEGVSDPLLLPRPPGRRPPPPPRAHFPPRAV